MTYHEWLKTVISRGGNWIDEEPGAATAGAEVRRLFRRARLQRVKTIVLAVLLGALGAAYDGYSGRSFQSRIIYRVTESDMDATIAPPPKKQLKSYVEDTIFSSERLVKIMKDHNLYSNVLTRDVQLAVENLREDIEVEVWRNYFVDARMAGDAGRSARIGITFHAKQPKLAYDVVQALGTLVTVTDGEERTRLARLAADQVAQDLIELKDKIDRQQHQLNVLLYMPRAIQSGEGAAFRTSQSTNLARVQAQDLKKSLSQLEMVLHDLEKRHDSYELRASLEQAQMGVRFELVDSGRVQRIWGTTRQRATLLFFAFFILTLPLCAMGVAAFDSRIYELEDVRRLGLRAVGRVAPFPGSDIEPLVDRLAENRVQ